MNADSFQALGESDMSWVSLDDGFADHPKVLDLTDAAFRLHVCAMCWVGRRLTDGAIRARELRILVAMLPNPPEDPASLLKEILDAGLWEETSDGWVIHDWLKYNPCAGKVVAKREASAERQRRFKERHAQTPDDCGNASDNALPNALPNALKTGSPPLPINASDLPNARSKTPPRVANPTPSARSEPSLGEPITPEQASALLLRFRESSRDADGVPRLTISPTPDGRPSSRTVEQFRSALERHHPSPADIDAMGRLLGSGEEFRSYRSVAISMLCQKPTQGHHRDNFEELLCKARTPDRPDRSQRTSGAEDRETPAHHSHIPYHETESYQREQERRAKLELETPEQKAAALRRADELVRLTSDGDAR